MEMMDVYELKSKSKLNPLQCIKAEKIYEEACEVMEKRPLLGTGALLEKMAFFRHVEHDYQEDIKEDPEGQIADHLHLYCLTRDWGRVMLSWDEFNHEYDSHPSLFPNWRERIWRHMLQCPIMLINTFQKVTAYWKDIIRFSPPPEEILKVAGMVLKRINIIEKVRRNFKFCEGCKHDGEVQCGVWEEVAFKVERCMGEPNPELSVRSVHVCFLRLKSACKIPQSLEVFKKDFANQPY